MSTFNGCGTMYYGHRDRWPDGSYIATEWFVIFWIPIFPLESFRIKEGGTRLTILGSKTSYQYISVPLNKAQVIRTYGITGIVAAAILSIFLLPRILDKGPKMTNAESPGSLFEAIAQIASFSYEPAIQKHPYIKEYLKNTKDPKLEWTLLVTAAGTGYVLLTEEDYPGEHDDIRRSMESINGLPGIVKKFMDFMTQMYEKAEQFYRVGMGMWIMRQITSDMSLIDPLPILWTV